MCSKKHPHSLKRSVHLQQFFFFFFCIVFLSVLSWLLLLTFSLSLSAIILSNIHAFFLLNDKNTHTLVLCSPVSVSIGLFFSPWLSPSLSQSLSLAPPPHSLTLSLSLLCSGCWHASSAWQSQDCYFIYLVFSPHIFLSAVSL